MKKLLSTIAMVMALLTACLQSTAISAFSESEEIKPVTFAGYRFGDVDYSGKIDMSDVVAIQKHIAELEEIKPLKLVPAMLFKPVPVDIGRSKANMEDVVLVQKHIAGLIKTFPIEECYQSDTDNYSIYDENKIEIKEQSPEYKKLFDLTAELLKDGLDEKNSTLISPVSVVLALASAANGADKETLTQMAKYLSDDTDLEKTNLFLKALQERLQTDTDDCKLQIANSVWFNEAQKGFTLKQSFSDTVKSVLSAEAFSKDFTSSDTLQEVNSWIEKNTFGMIKDMLKELKPETVTMLINAIAFEAKWERPYRGSSTDKFTNINNEKVDAEYLCQDVRDYIEAEGVCGFKKAYEGGKYSFVALLPDENTNVNDFVKGLTGEKLNKILSSEKHMYEGDVFTKLPKFTYEYGVNYTGALANKMPDAFNESKADFSNMVDRNEGAGGNAFIGAVIHNTFIELDENGTKAAAVTIIDIDTAAPIQDPPVKNIILDRPFAYAIIDNQTNLPIFIGTVLDIKTP